MECLFSLKFISYSFFIQTLNDESDPEPPEPIKGIPDFWLTLLKEVDNIGSMIQEHDEPILRHLIDICVELKSNPNVRLPPLNFF